MTAIFTKRIFDALLLARIISLVTLVLYFSSCASESTKAYSIDLNSGVNVNIDSVTADCLLNQRAMAIVDDTLIIANDNPEAFFETYELPSLRHIRSGGVNGQGPGELVSPMLNSMKPYFGHCIMVKGRTGFAVDIVDVETLKKVDCLYQCLPPSWNYVQDLIFVKDNEMAAENGDSPHIWAIFDKNGDIICQFPQNIPQDVESLAIDDFSKMVYDVSWGAVSTKNKTLAIGYRTFPVVEFYKFDGSFIAKLEVPYSMGEKLDNWLNKMYSTDDYVYLNFRNLSPNAKTVNTIVKADWNGNAKAMYALDRPVLSFAVDEINNKMYFTSNSESDDDFIYFFDL